MTSLSRLNSFLGRHYPWFILVFVGIGLLFCDFFNPLTSITVPIFTVITFANSLGGGFRDLARAVRHPLPVLTVLLVLHVAMPSTALGLGSLLFPSEPLYTLGLVLEFSLPTAVSGLMWVGMASGSLPLYLSILLLDTLLAPFIVPVVLRVLSGSVVELDAMGMMGDLVVMVAIPAVIAMTLYDSTHGRVKETVKPVLDPIAKMLLLLVVSINASSCAPFLRQVDRTLFLVMIVVVTLCFLGYFMGFLAAALERQKFPVTATVSLACGMRNISAGAVLASQYFPAQAMFGVAFSPLFLQAITAFVVKILLATKTGQAWIAQHGAPS